MRESFRAIQQKAKIRLWNNKKGLSPKTVEEAKQVRMIFKTQRISSLYAHSMFEISSALPSRFLQVIISMFLVIAVLTTAVVVLVIVVAVLVVVVIVIEAVVVVVVVACKFYLFRQLIISLIIF